ncbi:phosphotyrosine protein phosphatase [Marinicauda pacifica]|jgi:protein-tyrosine phosphatase|uniref:protein-tyrosine-phosphatase n=1 Tax=Marinicauda pacifica TaxID=1133559 RepID=A0A4S2HBI7_9PROT|nr:MULTISPECIES: low molecular weight protein-tyrosine-phosphatase [Marinicauda]TGY93330.1 low molecular weight phosphotyrosine protein phosphatase [Marinicauda pacifica]GGE44819.1 phosphotyrosine protein phosphatase [Marinicauda pacifica]
MKTQRILFICTGNICRSPMAKGVAMAMADRFGRSRLTFDAAGTGDWHVGEAPDPRAVEAAARRGYNIAHERARAVTSEDFSLFDHLVAMDEGHRRWLVNARTSRSLPDRPISLLMDWSVGRAGTDVPDPYYADENAFEHALDLIERGVEGLVRRA